MNSSRLPHRGRYAAFVVAILLLPTMASAGPWSTQFGLATINREIRATTVWNGKLVLGGDFTRAGKVGAPYVVAWNGTEFEPLGDGAPSRVLTLGVHAGELYAYTVPFSGTPSALRKWDGNTWSTVVSLPSGQINAISSNLGMLYVGGTFTTIGGVPANRVASFDGTNWAPLGTGTSGTVNALSSFDGSLYAGGFFQTAGGVATGPVARWDGTAWSSLGAGVSGFGVSSLFADASGLVVGGDWDLLGGAPCDYPARWNGVSWQCLSPTPLPPWPGPAVSGGMFDQFAGDIIGTNNQAGGGNTTRWTGSDWVPLGDGLGASGQLRLTTYNGNAYLTGGYLVDFPGGAAVLWRAWNGATWSNPDPWEPGMHGVSHAVHGLIPYGGELVALGALTYVGDSDHAVPLRTVAAWDGSGWHQLGTGVTGGSAFAATIHQGDLIVGGWLIGLNGVGRWNGTSWSAFGPGLSYPASSYPGAYVYDVESYGTDFVACGAFTQSGATTVTGIARWDGSAWQPLGTGFDVAVYNDIPHAMLAEGSDLYVGGEFVSAGGVAAARIARWDGGAWNSVGSGFADGTVFALTRFGDELIAGGTFSLAGGSPANGAARWRNGSWQPMGSNALDVQEFGMHGGALHAAGKFLRPDLTTHVGLARWDGSTWEPLGGSASVAAGSINAHALASFGDEIFMGGAFDFVDGTPSVNVAAWQGTPLAEAPPAATSGILFAAPRPNPSASGVAFSYTLPKAMHVRLVIHDLLGREVARVADGWQEAGTKRASWDGRLAGGARAAGIYEAVLVTDQGRLTRKVVWLH